MLFTSNFSVTSVPFPVAFVVPAASRRATALSRFLVNVPVITLPSSISFSVRAAVSYENFSFMTSIPGLSAMVTATSTVLPGLTAAAGEATVTVAEVAAKAGTPNDSVMAMIIINVSIFFIFHLITFRELPLLRQ